MAVLDRARVGSIERPFGGSRNDRFWVRGTVISSLAAPTAPAVTSDDDEDADDEDEIRPSTTQRREQI